MEQAIESITGEDLFAGNKKRLKPGYKSCKGKDLSQLEDSSTEADFCINCTINKVKNFLGLRDTQKNLNLEDKKKAKEFKQKLKKRVIGQVSARIFQMKKLKSCVDFNGKWFPGWDRLKTEDKTALKQECQQQTNQLKSAVKSRWSDMRAHLSLSAPRFREDRIIADRKTWFNSAPSHVVSGFASPLSPLTPAEKKSAEKKYIEALTKTKTKIKPEVLKNRLLKNLPLNLNSEDMSQLKWAEKKFRQESRKKYLEKVGELPILAYLNKGSPSGKDLAQAIDKMEGQLQTMLKKIQAKDVDLGLLLSFNPLVEELLKENKNYCLVAEAGRIEAEGDERFENYALLGASLLSVIPCFAGGIVGKVFCLGAESLVGVKGYKLAKEGMEESLGRVLTGKDYEKIANLDGRQRELFLEKLFLPLGVWGGAMPFLRSAKTAKHTREGAKFTQANTVTPQTKAQSVQKYANSLPSYEKQDYMFARKMEAWAQGIKPFKDKGVHFVERTFKNPNFAKHKWGGSPRTIIHKTAPSAENLRLRRKYNPRIRAYIEDGKKVSVTRLWDNHSTMSDNIPQEFSKIEVDMEEVFKNIPENLRKKFSPEVEIYISESGEIVMEKQFHRTTNKNANGNKILSGFWHDEKAGFRLVQKADVDTKEFMRGEELRTVIPGNKLTTEDMVKRAKIEERNMPLDITLSSGESMSVKISDIHQIPPNKIHEIKATSDSQSLNFIFKELNIMQTAAVTPEQMKYIDLPLIRPDQARILSEEQVQSLRYINEGTIRPDAATLAALMEKFSPKQISDISKYGLKAVPDWPRRLKTSEQVNAITSRQLKEQPDKILRDFYSRHFFNMDDKTKKRLRSLRPKSFWNKVMNDFIKGD